jgi:hypothetical protein
MAFHHLRVNRALRMLGEQRVEDLVAEAPGDRGRGGVQVEDHHLRFQHGRDRPRRAGGSRCKEQRWNSEGSGSQQSPVGRVRIRQGRLLLPTPAIDPAAGCIVTIGRCRNEARYDIS